MRKPQLSLRVSCMFFAHAPPPHPLCSPGDSSGGGLEGDCGADLAEPPLACDSYDTCAPLAAAACAQTPGCVSFGLSSAWGFGKAKLFAAGSSGLTPNPQWTVWVQNGKDSMDMYARARAEGRHPGDAAWGGPSTSPTSESCYLYMHTAPGVFLCWDCVVSASVEVEVEMGVGVGWGAGSRFAG